MRKITVAILLLFSVLSWAGTTPNPAEYTVNVHVAVSSLVLEGNERAYRQKLSVVIDGKKYELQSIVAPQMLLLPGDYKAKLVKDEHGTKKYESWQIYELMFPDNKTRRFLVVGQTE